SILPALVVHHALESCGPGPSCVVPPSTLPRTKKEGGLQEGPGPHPDEAGIPEFVEEVAALLRVRPGAPEQGRGNEGLEKLEMARPRLVEAGENAVHDL